MSVGTLFDESKIDDAFKAVRALDQLYRIEYFKVNNTSQHFEIVLALSQGLDESNNTPAGNQKDTGLTVSGQQVGPGNSAQGTVQPGINVMATHGKSSLHWRRTIAPYDEGNINGGDQYAPAGRYFRYCEWNLTEHALNGVLSPQILSNHALMPE
jgi:hypothetical protein